MTKLMLGVLAVAIVAGIASDLAWGHWIGVSVGVVIFVVGAVTLVLRRNQRDLENLEKGRPPAADTPGGDPTER